MMMDESTSWQNLHTRSSVSAEGILSQSAGLCLIRNLHVNVFAKRNAKDLADSFGARQAHWIHGYIYIGQQIVVSPFARPIWATVYVSSHAPIVYFLIVIVQQPGSNRLLVCTAKKKKKKLLLGTRECIVEEKKEKETF